MGFLFQLPAIVGGTVLVIERIQSQNFVAGTVGWAIYSNGDAEFNNVVARGELLVGSNPGRHIRAYIDTTFPFDPTPTIEWSTGSANEALPATAVSSDPLSSTLVWAINGPKHTTGNRAGISINSTSGPASSEIDLSADHIAVSVPAVYESVWTAPTLLNSWADVAGARVGVLKDAASNVHIRGSVQAGTVATIFNLAAGYRPSQTMQFVVRSASAAGNYSVLQVQTNGDVVVNTNLAQAQIACRLDLDFTTL